MKIHCPLPQNVTVKEVTEVSAAYIAIDGTVKSSEYRNAMMENYELCKKEHIRNWLQDNSKAGILSLEDQQWVSQDLIPEAAKYVDKIAVVISQDVFRKFAAKNILEKEKDKLNFQYFNSLQDAKNWLLAD